MSDSLSDDQVLERNLSGIAPDTIVDVWIDSANAKKVADKGFKFVHASSEYYYLVRWASPFSNTAPAVLTD